MLSKKAKYALKAMRALVLAGEGAPLTAAQLSEAERIPRKFLEIILHQLRQQGLLSSRPGPRGGYTLAVPAEKVSVGRIIRLLDGPLASIPCASETAFQPCEECADIEGCAIRIVMRRVRDATARILDGTSLAEFAALPGRPKRRPSRGVAAPGTRV
jgi:Rrf2 family protein